MCESTKLTLGEKGSGRIIGSINSTTVISVCEVQMLVQLPHPSGLNLQ
jgi:hypothetical protein